jgi:TPP-dependent indolepyruvate ferredoxin oxidoreductase alpha subunit
VIPDSLPAKWQAAVMRYAPLFAALARVRGGIVTGDVGITSFFAFPPFDCIDITTYMGGSLPLAAGAALALGTAAGTAWAVTGDFAFLGAGHLGLVEARQRGVPLKVLLIRNERAETTGNQTIQPGLLEHVLGGFAPFLRSLEDPGNEREVGKVMEEAGQAREMRIVVADYRAVP